MGCVAMLFGLIGGKKKKNTYYKTKYYEYLQSKKWKKIRLKAAKRAHFICECCEKKCTDKKTLKGFQVHHMTYEHLYDELHHMDDLVFLCKDCHEKTTKRIQEIKDRAKKDIADISFKHKN